MAYGSHYVAQAAPSPPLPGVPPANAATSTQTTAGEETSRIESTLTAEEQALVNKNRQYLTSVQTIKAHNTRLSTMISFATNKSTLEESIGVVNSSLSSPF